jgi:hypothetical protein
MSQKKNNNNNNMEATAADRDGWGCSIISRVDHMALSLSQRIK